MPPPKDKYSTEEEVLDAVDELLNEDATRYINRKLTRDDAMRISEEQPL